MCLQKEHMGTRGRSCHEQASGADYAGHNSSRSWLAHKIYAQVTHTATGGLSARLRRRLE